MNRKEDMKAHFNRIAKQLSESLARLDDIERALDLEALHRLVVDLKTSLPERLSYEHSPLLLDGLRVSNSEDIPAYADQLRERLTEVRNEYRRRAQD